MRPCLARCPLAAAFGLAAGLPATAAVADLPKTLAWTAYETGSSGHDPILMAYADKDAGTVYAMTRAIFEQYDSVKDAALGAEGRAPDRQRLDRVVPLHKGAIRYYKEAGRWNGALQANNDADLKRAALLRKVWDGYAAANRDKPEAAFAEGWQKARAALEANGLPVVWRTW